MNLNDYTESAQDELKATSILMACVVRMKATLPRINGYGRLEFTNDIDRLEQTIKWHEQNMANVAEGRKRNIFA